MAAALGRPFMPWQVDAADVIGELSDDGASMRYPYVVVHVPRRAGKGILTLGTMLHRLTTARGRRCHYTAQTRADASQVFRDEWVPMMTASPLYPRALKLRQSNGSEAVTLKGFGSTLNLFAPTSTAVHGQDSDAAAVDEAWAFTLDQGGAIEAGVQPAQLTRPYRQLLIVSAGGTLESTWLDRWMTLARDGTPGVALIDYGANADDDLDDPAVWERVHPAVGQTITLEGIAAMRATLDAEEFARAVLGVWTQGNQAPAVIDREQWRGLEDETAAPGGRRLAYGLAVAHDGAAASIVAASVDAAGRGVLEVVEWAPGTSWVPGAWRAIRNRTRGRLFVDALGPAGPVVDALIRARLPVEVMTTATYATACAGLLEAVRSGMLAHRGQPVLDAAAQLATARAVGDRWVWERKGPDVSAVEAASVALWGAVRPSSGVSSTVAAG